MTIDNVLQDTTNMEALLAEREQQALREEMADPAPRVPRTSMGPVIQLEKSDIQFWVDLATLVVLLLILMRQ